MNNNKKSLAYWEQRRAQQMYEQMGIAEQSTTRISQQYYKASQKLSKDIDGVFNRYKDKFALSEQDARTLLKSMKSPLNMQELSTKLQIKASLDGNPDLKAFLEAPNYATRIQRLQELQKSIDKTMKQLYGIEKDIHTSTYRDIMEDTYNKTMFDLQRRTGVGFPFSDFENTEYERILNSKFLGKNYSERIWNNTQEVADSLQREMCIGLLSGTAEREIANLIAQQFAVASHKARRLIRTESAYRTNEMDALAYAECGLDKYIILATLDMRTSKLCQSMDMKEFKLKDKQVGVNFPPFHPYCRTVTIANVSKDELTSLTRKARDPETGNNYVVRGDLSYGEWKQGLQPLSDKAQLQYKLINNLNVDKKQYEKYIDILGENEVGSFEKFRSLKYNEPSEWEVKKREFSTINSINAKDWSDTFKTKVKSVYYSFRKDDIECSLHGAQRFVERNIDKKTSEIVFTHSDIVELFNTKPNYKQKDGRLINFNGKFAIIRSEKTNEVVSIVVRNNPGKEWIKNEG